MSRNHIIEKIRPSKGSSASFQFTSFKIIPIKETFPCFFPMYHSLALNHLQQGRWKIFPKSNKSRTGLKRTIEFWCIPVNNFSSVVFILTLFGNMECTVIIQHEEAINQWHKMSANLICLSTSFKTSNPYIYCSGACSYSAVSWMLLSSVSVGLVPSPSTAPSHQELK